MYYEINIAIHGQHYFATAPRSITTEEKAQQIAKELQHFYISQHADPYAVSVSIAYRETTGREIPLNTEA